MNLGTEPTNPTLIIKKNALQPGESYTFYVDVTNENGTGSASIGMLSVVQ